MNLRLSALLLLCVLAACADSTAPVVDESLRLIARGGNGQAGFAGEALRFPVVVQVMDGAGRGVADVEVRFEVVTGGGVVEPAMLVTDESGLALAHWRLGPAATRTQRLVATTPDGSAMEVGFEATALTPDEGDVLIVHGARGPLRGVVLFQITDRLELFASRAAADTIVYLPPTADAFQVLVLSTANRPLLEATTWTAGRDTVEVTLLPPVAVDFVFTVVSGDFEVRRVEILEQLATMRDIWDRAGAGVAIGDVRIVNSTDPGGNEHILTSGLCDRTLASTVIQVSYVTTVGGGEYGAYGCTTGNVFMGAGTSAYPNLLAHEVGHVFALRHASGVMNPGVPGTFLSDGQIFMAHFDERSGLNTIFHAQPESLQRYCTTSRAQSFCLPEEYELPPSPASGAAARATERDVAGADAGSSP